MAAAKGPQTQLLHPAEQAAPPAMLENEAEATLGRGDRYLRETRANGGLDDDPTDSGEPVKNRKSFSNLKGGR
jgi:hypothetical protein